MHTNDHCDTALELIQESLNQYIKRFELKKHPHQSQAEKDEQHLAELEAQYELETTIDEKAAKYHILETGVVGWYSGGYKNWQ